MIVYAIRKFFDYFIAKIDLELEEKALKILNIKEQEIYFNMDYYDRYHGLSVYSKLMNKNMPEIYLKLAILHDCGKENANFLIRTIHKFGIKTKLREHSYNGYKKLKNIDKDLANLILNHHNKTDDKYMKIFQKADDDS